MGWEEMLANVLSESRLRNDRPTVLDKGELEAVGMVFPPGLRPQIEKAAKAERRSLASEITHFLEDRHI